MKAAVVDELGRSPVYADFPDPAPRDGAVVATVAAAAIKNIDRALISGTHYGSPGLHVPLVAGMDGVARLDDGRLVYT
ncbi:MAG: zinc-binding alcohol dehydrogenase family protein, partial [Mycobacterium sp.]